MIVSPVSRHLVVADIDKSIAFYKAVLGFEKGAATPESKIDTVVVSGTARIHFHSTEDAVDSSGRFRPRGEAIVFFETDNVKEMYEALKERGANPTIPERVNWIKMEMFEVKDIDGHRLWFGQSFHEYTDMHTPPGKGQLRQIMPAFPCKDVPAAVNYYRDVLGFSVNYQQQDLGVMDRDSVRLLLVAGNATNIGTGACGVYIKNADELCAELKAKGAHVTKEPESHPWGLRDFEVVDMDGNHINFAQTFE